MTGGWGGTSADTWLTIGVGSGARTCNETWVIDRQHAGSFSGSYQRSPSTTDDCSGAGTLDGEVLPGGQLTVRTRSNTSSGCVLIGGNPEFRGFVSPAGGLTVRNEYSMRCPTLASRYGGPDTLDYRMNGTVSLNRR